MLLTSMLTQGRVSTLILTRNGPGQHRGGTCQHPFRGVFDTKTYPWRSDVSKRAILMIWVSCGGPHSHASSFGSSLIARPEKHSGPDADMANFCLS